MSRIGTFSREPTYLPVSRPPKMMLPSGLSISRRSRLNALLSMRPCSTKLSRTNGWCETFVIVLVNGLRPRIPLVIS